MEDEEDLHDANNEEKAIKNLHLTLESTKEALNKTKEDAAKLTDYLDDILQFVPHNNVGTLGIGAILLIGAIICVYKCSHKKHKKAIEGSTAGTNVYVNGQTANNVVGYDMYPVV